MGMIDALAGALVAAAAIYLIGLAAVAWRAPAVAARYLLGFVGSAATHYLELAIRLLLGAAFLQYAPRMRWPALFDAVGLILLLTTAGLLVIPWRWHRRFAQWAVPQALRQLPAIAAASLLLGGGIGVAMVWV